MRILWTIGRAVAADSVTTWDKPDLRPPAPPPGERLERAPITCAALPSPEVPVPASLLPLAALAVLSLLACGDKDVGDDTASVDGGATTGWQAPEGGVIPLSTRDGLTLQADYHPASAQGRPGVVLLHMIPPQNDRSNWPSAFVDTLVARDWSVLNVDRRGAGGSEGSPTDAYEGEAGRYDVEAAVQRLVDDGYGPVGIMGASNGTTSMIDYAAWATGEGLTRPVVLAYLTGGTYTEGQTPMTEVADLPSVFACQTTENAWTEVQRSLDPGTWAFHEYPGAGHGTQMLQSDDADALTTALVDYFSGVLEG